MRPVASSLPGQIYNNQQSDSHRPRRWIFVGGQLQTTLPARGLTYLKAFDESQNDREETAIEVNLKVGARNDSRGFWNDISEECIMAAEPAELGRLKFYRRAAPPELKRTSLTSRDDVAVLRPR